MEEAKGERESPSLVIERFPRDLLRRLAGNGCFGERPEALGGAPDEVELSLGLSLGGCFGVDPKGKKLVRSSSIASFSSLTREHEFPLVAPALVRTSSLPTETEEERRKRKELQSLKRLEAKRKRLEKRNSIKPGAARSDEDADGGKKSLTAPVTIGGAHLEHSVGSQFSRASNSVSPLGLLALPAGSKRSVVPAADAARYLSPMSRGSVGAQGSGSFGMFDSERPRPAQGLNLSVSNSDRNVKNTSTAHSIPSHKATTVAPTSEVGKPITVFGGEGDPLKKVASEGANPGRNIMGEMPCVSTRGDGPNGRRIEGFLYKYRKGEEVRIVCVCHGSFLTPAEFVKHAGGGDVAHPLRHIVVNPSPSALL